MSQAQPGEYVKALDLDKRSCAYVVCPKCCKGLSISQAIHQIDDSGVVTPSFVCTHPGCTFHEMIKLDKWDRIYLEDVLNG